MNMTTSSQNKARTITLDFPFTRGDQTIDSILIQKPVGGAFRGLSLPLVFQGDYDTLEKLIPRITMPVIHREDIASGTLDAADLMQIAAEIVDFLCPAAGKITSPLP